VTQFLRELFLFHPTRHECGRQSAAGSFFTATGLVQVAMMLSMVFLACYAVYRYTMARKATLLLDFECFTVPDRYTHSSTRFPTAGSAAFWIRL